MRARFLLLLLSLSAGALLVAMLLWPAATPDPAAAPPGAAEPPVAETAAPALAGTDAGDETERTALSAEDGGEPAPPGDAPGLPSGTTLVRVRGRVLDLAGVPLAGVPVVARRTPRRPLAESDGAGRFACSLPIVGRSATLEVLAGRFATVRGCVVEPRDAEREQILVAAPAVPLAGRVVDEAGAALAGVRVGVETPDELLRAFPLPLDRARRAFPTARTDAGGAFRLAAVPAPRGAQVVAEAEGYRALRIAVPEVAREDLLLELQATSATRDRLEGIVLLPTGAPAAGAEVRYEEYVTTTGADGLFDLPLDPQCPDHIALAAAREGLGTAVVARLGELVRAHAPLPPPPLTLRLGERSLAIAGRIVDEGGGDPSRWRVFLSTGTALTEGRLPPALAEGLGGGRTEADTDEAGRFRLTGLLDRAYDLKAWHLDSLQVIEAPAVPAGTEDLRLLVPGDTTRGAVRGRVVARDGTPLAAVQVAVTLVLHRRGPNSLTVGGAEVETDATGRFELEDVPRADVLLAVTGDDVVPRSVNVADLADPEHAVIEVARRVHFRLLVRGGEAAGAQVELLDAAGRPLPLYLFEARGWSTRSRIPLADGGGGVRAVSEDAVVLRVVRVDGEGAVAEVARQPLYLVPGEVNEIPIELP